MPKLLIHAPQYLPNLSSMIRTAEFYGFTDIYIYDEHNLLKEPTTKKERAQRKHMGRVWTAGALDYITIHVVKDDITFLKATNNQRVIGTLVNEQATSIKDFTFEENDLVIVGNERLGLPDYLIPLLDKSIYIPQRGHTNCLNVAVSFGIVVNALIQ